MRPSYIYLSSIAAAIFAVGLASGQPANNAGPAGVPTVVSPEVAADRRITFRLYAPNAQAVTLNGDFFTEGGSGMALVKDAGGVWSVTLPAQEPGIFGYYFRLDGVRMPDPGNLLLSSGAEFLKSYVEVPGDGPQFWSVRDVPHGELHEVLYRNPSLAQAQRRIYVYTPPGYDPAAAKTYPVAYLYHSTTDNETFWPRVGRANYIMDNLIAEGKAKPAILVMPFGHTSVPRGPEEGAGGHDRYDVAVIGDDLVNHIIPTMEEKFRVGRTAKDRAIFGFAMGGYQSATIGLNHPGVFGYVAAASANFLPDDMDLAVNFQPLTGNLALAKSGLTYVGLIVGAGEPSAIPRVKRVADYLTGIGIKNEWTTPQDGKHLWQTWRGYFRELMERKFFVDDPYGTPPIDAKRGAGD
jgi:enterochelin esterase-like enzyme